MEDECLYINSITNSYPNNILKEFDYSDEATLAITIINQELTELFNFVEPGLFNNKIIVVKNLKDKPIFSLEESISLKMNKAKLFNFNQDIVIQLFSDRNILMWEDTEYSSIFKCNDNITYLYENNKEKFFLKGKEVDVTICAFGSRFSDEFNNLEKQLNNYYIHKVKYSSCPILQQAWSSEKRIFFKGGGKDIPEKYIQESLHNFIKDLSIFKGEVGQFDPTREHNLNVSKPVDIIVRWEKSNRIALIEIKWLGKSIHEGEFKSKFNNSRANYGYKQLKEYFDLAKRDNPNKIIKCYLVVIDARRWQTSESTSVISYSNGMYYLNKDIKLDDDKKYHLLYKNMNQPIRMFVEPICD